MVTGDGALIAGAEFDHLYSRERHGFTDTWLICRQCHRGLLVNGCEANAAAFAGYKRGAA